MDIQGFLSQLEVFSGMSGPDLKLLASGATVVPFDEGRVIISQGEKGDSVWVIAEGAVEVLRKVAGNAERSVAFLGAGELVGEMSAVTGDTPRADVVAGEKCKMIRISAGVFKSVLGRNPKCKGRISRAMAKRYSGLVKDKP